jgi:NADPH-dependent 2,4-dienoyl-CoA reductase/sulfur reductase-like enzyme
MTAPRLTTDVLVVGGGPAGLAAAAQAAAAGLSVTLVDERVTLGGQIFKRMGPGFEVESPGAIGRDYAAGAQLIASVTSADIEVRLRTAVLALEGLTAIVCEDESKTSTIEAQRIILAPGAYDRPVAFPGWTLPGVLTAGGAQTLVKTQRVLPGERIVFAGSGPVALAFPAQLHHYGANIALVCEAGPAPRPADAVAMLTAAPGNLSLLRDALGYRLELLRARIRLRYRRIVVAAEGDGRVESVVHAAVDQDWRPIPGSEERVACDTLCLGYGFLPSVELLRLAGCVLDEDEDRGGAVARLDQWMRTSAVGIHAAGDGTGVEGSLVAIDEGRLAALGVALDLGVLSAERAEREARPIRRRLQQRRAFRMALSRMHRVGTGIYELSTDDTVICRCEEVTRAVVDLALAASADSGVVKGLTRAGMGLCQGRNCQRTIAGLIAQRHDLALSDVTVANPRLPARPVPLAAIADDTIEDHGFFTAAAAPRS